ncbi:MAG TPA: DEAD/DEAH box helicase [Aridibacter sp.]|nr:DEAD/DEAH box helicase [Aridibacter sp.]
MNFSELGLNDALLRRCESQNFTTPTPIQAKAIPLVKEGIDLIACAETGTGKTAAFLLPVLDAMIRERRPGVNLLVVAPTRELAMQIEKDYLLFAPKNFKSVCLIGGTNINKQTNKLRSGVSTVIATPGRLIDHVERGNVDLRTTRTLVLDEADRMLDMGFLPQIRKILGFLPAERQNLLFSATMPDSVKGLAYSMMEDPEFVEASPRNKPPRTIEEIAYTVPGNSKIALLLDLLENGELEKVIIFTATKRGADRLAHILNARELNAGIIHSDRTQSQRERELQDFKAGKKQVLVATDIASRGIDIDSVTHVVNYDVPSPPEDYVHRVGRTGRAGRLGQAITLVTPIEELAMRSIEMLTEKKIERIEHPEFGPKAIRERKLIALAA